jgi:hypothetical protein
MNLLHPVSSEGVLASSLIDVNNTVLVSRQKLIRKIKPVVDAFS